MEKYIPIKDLITLGNIRTISRDDVKDLATSMAELGQVVPIEVYAWKNQWVVKYGHRRLEAAKALGWDTIWAVVQPEPEDEASLLICQLAENEQRRGMSYIERAKVYQQLKALGYSQKKIASKVGASEVDVSLALATLRANPKLQRAVEEGRLQPSALEPLLGLDQETQATLADTAIRLRTVRNITNLVKAHKERQNAAQHIQAQSILPDDDIDPMEELSMKLLEDALAKLKLVQQSKIEHPELVRKARPTIEELLSIAKKLERAMGIEREWRDMEDL